MKLTTQNDFYSCLFIWLLSFFFMGNNQLEAKAHLITPSLDSKAILSGLKSDLTISPTLGNGSLGLGSFADQSIRNVSFIKPAKKIKITVFSSSGGAGHILATQAMTEDLQDFCDIKSVMVLDEILGKMDPVSWITFGKYNGEKVYNSMLAHGWIKSMNFVARHLASGQVLSRLKTVEKLMTEYLKKEKPDILISVVPFVNLPASNVATKLGIPFLLVTTDNDLTNWLRGVQKIKHNNFRMTIGYDLKQTRGKALLKNVAPKNIYVTGFPLKKAFREPKNVQEIRKTWNIPDGKFVIMVSLGGNGGMATFKYIRNLVKHAYNAHILACCGRNDALAKKLEGLKISDPLSMSIIKFTPYIADLMAVSDVLITKPGPGIINEALYSNLPMIIDCTAHPLYWEKAGINFVLNNGFGKKVEYFRDLNHMVKKFINNKPFYNGIKKRLADFKKPVFGDFLRAKIKELYRLRPITKIDDYQEHYQQLLEPVIVVPAVKQRVPVLGKGLNEEALLLLK